MTELLKPISTSFIKKDLSTRPPRTNEEEIGPNLQPTKSVASVDEAINALCSSPDRPLLWQSLKFVDPDRKKVTKFNISLPSSQAAQLLKPMVDHIIPTYWTELKASPKELKTFLRCIQNVSGIGAILAKLKSILSKSKYGKGQSAATNISPQLSEYIEVLSFTLQGNKFLSALWERIFEGQNAEIYAQGLWKELVTLLCKGRLLSISAEATQFLKASSEKLDTDFWVGNGANYSEWIGENVAFIASKYPPEESILWKSLGEFAGQALGLGYTGLIQRKFTALYYVLIIYTDHLVQKLYSRLLYAEEHLPKIRFLVLHMPAHQQRAFLHSSLRVLSLRYLKDIKLTNDELWWKIDSDIVSGIAAILSTIIKNDDCLMGDLVYWLVGGSTGELGGGTGIRRAAIAAMSSDHTRIQTILEQSMLNFGDNLYIQHTPIAQQELNAQVLLLTAGYVHRSTPMHLFTLARSSTHINAISNRLSATNLKSRLLGMLVGVAISELIDKPDKRMVFSMEEIGTLEAQWYKSLTKVEDCIGSIGALQKPDGIGKDIAIIRRPQETKQKPNEIKKLSTNISSNRQKQAESDSDDDLVAYQKPDSDPEDDDEDATLVQRNLPKAPVYIRDLLTGLRDTENYENHRLSLYAAAPLIRRKANFGSELSSHAVDLASILIGLGDKFNLPDFLRLRLQAMMALVSSLPAEMGPYFAKAFFVGDYSLGQRASILQAIGMGARALAGFKDEETSADAKEMFPLKTLPPTLHNLYVEMQLAASPSDSVERALTRDLIAPATKAALSNSSGQHLRALATRNKTTTRRDPSAKKPKPNALVPLVLPAFFSPLAGRWYQHIKAPLTRQSKESPLTSPYLLPPLLNTLSIIIHAAGPSPPFLGQMTTEYWDLLLALRTRALLDGTVMQAVLGGFLVLLQANSDKASWVRDLGVQVAEAGEWVKGVLEGERREEVRGLAVVVLGMIADVLRNEWQM
ncbi:MAG: telomere binding protein [Trizodia sp. TS-e1964]|nr:MAG: telomere binding protein [Trizodia sp. TS-e1964]